MMNQHPKKRTGTRTIQTMTEELLKKIYYDVSNPASFGSVDKLYREAKSQNPQIKRSDVESFLSGQIAYTLHRKIRRTFTRNPVLAKFHADVAQADLIDVTRFAKDNYGNNFILTLIDVFTKYAYAVPIQRKGATDVVKALESIFVSYRPSSLQTDEGKEFTNAAVQKLLKDRYIKFYLAKNENIKCAVVERFQRTLMSKIQKYFTSFGTHKYVDVLDNIMHAYNNTYHRTIRMTPQDARSTDTKTIFRNLYGFDSMRDYLKHLAKQKEKQSIGESVRIPAHKNKFTKGYSQNFTDEIYNVKAVNTSNKRPVYKLKDYKNKEIPGTFYEEEIQRVRNEDKYRVTVLDERKRGRGKQYLIKWTNFPDLEPEWIAASKLENII